MLAALLIPAYWVISLCSAADDARDVGRVGQHARGRRAARVVVHDHALQARTEGGEHRLVPRLRAGLRVGHPVRPEPRGGEDGADLGVRVGAMHRGHVLGHAGRVRAGPAVVGLRRLAADRHRAAGRRGVAMRVGLPVGPVGAVAVDLVADLPVLHAVAAGQRAGRPRGGERRGAGAVVHRDDGLRADGLRRGHEAGKAGVRGHVAALCRGAGLPVVDVGVRAARVAQRVDPRGLEQPGDRGVVHVPVVDGGVEADRARRDRAEPGGRVHGDGVARLGRRRGCRGPQRHQPGHRRPRQHHHCLCEQAHWCAHMSHPGLLASGSPAVGAPRARAPAGPGAEPALWRGPHALATAGAARPSRGV